MDGENLLKKQKKSLDMVRKLEFFRRYWLTFSAKKSLFFRECPLNLKDGEKAIGFIE